MLIPSQSEIIEVLREHPLIKLRERVKSSYLVGSFAKESMGIGQTRDDSDVDILLEVVPQKGIDALELEDKYRRALRTYFMKHDIRGKDDSIHPQWQGRRVDLYFTYDASTEERAKIKLSSPRITQSAKKDAYQDNQAEISADAPLRPRQR